MIDILLNFWFILLGVLWIAPGLVAAKGTIAWYEAKTLRECPKQHIMLPDDWIGAVWYAIWSFIGWPLLLTVKVGRVVLRPVAKPAAEYLKPPVQKAWEGHVQAMHTQKALIMANAEAYQAVKSWKPEDGERQEMLDNLEAIIREQMRDLYQMTNNTIAFDGDFLDATKQEMKALTERAWSA